MSEHRDPLWDGSPDPELDGLSALLSEYRGEAALPELPERRPAPRRWGWGLALAAGLLLAAGLWFASIEAPSEQGAQLVPAPTPAPEEEGVLVAAPWSVSTLEGPELCPDGGCTLRPGQWLETRADQEALLAIADIGWMELAPHTRLRLVETGPEQHRLELARGRVTALVIAPPRLLVVDTPAARAVDLGCGYSLSVDARGEGSLSVTSGWVALETLSEEVIVAAGLRAPIHAHGPGLPRRPEARLSASLDAWDLHPDPETLAILLSLAEDGDALTLWHVLRRAPEDQRAAVLDRVESLLGPLEARDALLTLSEAPLRDLLVRSTERWGAPPP